MGAEAIVSGSLSVLAPGGQDYLNSDVADLKLTEAVSITGRVSRRLLPFWELGPIMEPYARCGQPAHLCELGRSPTRQDITTTGKQHMHARSAFWVYE